MDIETGLFDYMVLQRSRKDVSDQAVAGRATATGRVEATISAGGRVLRGWARKPVGRAARGRFEARIRGLPAGGPYRIELRMHGRAGDAGDGAVARDVLVGDVWVLAGQSNMEGVGWRHHALPSHARVRAFYMTDEWDEARDPLHTLWCALDPVHGGNPKASRHKIPHHHGVGPGLAFGREMLRHTGVPQGLIACAHGGTSMAQWDPALRRLGGKSFYGAMLRRVRRNGGRVAGVVWYQGCSDANREAAALYTNRMAQLVRAMRRDFGDARLPFAMVQISRVVGWGPDTERPWNSIQDQQRRLPARVPRCAVVPAIDLELDDAIHISGSSQNRLGRRLAAAMDVLRRGRQAGLPPIELKSVAVVKNPVSNLADVVVRFANVAGRLRADGSPSGFCLVNGSAVLPSYRTDVDKDRVIVHLCAAPGQTPGNLHYGFGTNPYCNVRDEADRSVPVFGPVPLGAPRAFTPFVRSLRVSAILPHRAVTSLPRRLSLRGVRFAPRAFDAEFCSRHEELQKAGAALVWYACRIRCASPMRLAALLGYDGPVRVWLDGREVLCDPNGTNPAVQDARAIPFRARRGTHEIVVALDSHDGLAWGVFLRFERLDVSRRRLEREGPDSVEMPEVLG
jgi:sialate O-acetylesterase